MWLNHVLGKPQAIQSDGRKQITNLLLVGNLHSYRLPVGDPTKEYLLYLSSL